MATNNNELANKTSNENVEVRCAADVIGEWGPWQRKITVIFILMYIVTPFHNVGSLFYAPKLKFWCGDPKIEQKNTTADNECHIFAFANETCRKWEYDTSIFKSTIISEWDLVCDRSWVVSASSSAYQLGYAFSSISFGLLSDKFGRLFSLKIGFCLEIVSGFSQALSLSIEHFLISRFALGVADHAVCFTGLLLIFECVGISHRARVTVLTGFGWVFGYMLQPGMAYLIGNFRYLQIIVSSYLVVLLSWMWRFPESPRWQLTHGQNEEAEKAILEAAIVNGMFSREEIECRIAAFKRYIAKEEKKFREAQKQTFLDLWKVPQLSRHCLILFLAFFGNTFIYYGLTLNLGDLGGNVFINCFVYAIAEGVANVFAYVAVDKLNRRPLSSAMKFVAGAACFAVIPFLILNCGIIYRIIPAMIGIFCICCSFQIVFLQTSEIIPTTLRQIGVGSGSLVARFGSVTAPFLSQLSEKTHPAVPLAIFGCVSCLSGITLWFLPETKGVEIPDTVDETA